MKTIRFLFPVLLLAAVISCKKNSTVTPVKTNPNPVPVTTGTITGGKGVYVAGWESFYKVAADSLPNSTGIARVAKIWKDGKAVNLTDGTHDAVAYSVYANGTDVYAVGFEFNKDSIQTAMLWKNGVPQTLGDGKNKSVGNGVYLSGSDVYVAGNSYTPDGSAIPVLWKNGVGSNLSGSGIANSVFAYNGTIYVAGQSPGLLPALWNNGVLTELKGSETQDYPANSVFVDQGNVYVAGQGVDIPAQQTDWFEKLDTLNIGLGYWNSWTQELNTHVAMAWKNGAPSNPTGGNQVSSVFVGPGGVFLAGDQSSVEEIPTIWRNGLPTALNIGVPTTGANTNTAGYVAAVAQSQGSVVYGAGWRSVFYKGTYNTYDVPVLWQDGVIGVLNNSDNAATLKLYPKTGGRAKSVFIVN